MKGVILSANPAARIVDLTPDIPPQDIQAAAFNLLATYKDFPPGTIHVAVVDPGVGSKRRPVSIECAGRFFVGPDNGIFSFVCSREGKYQARHLTNRHFFREPTSATFHGRDVFAPVAAALSLGVDPEELGPRIDDLVQLDLGDPTLRDDGSIEAAVMHIDRFGNCITNLTRDHFERVSGDAPRLLIGDCEITSFRTFFAEDDEAEGELFMIVGSAGFIEIAAQNASAAAILGARRGETVRLI